MHDVFSSFATMSDGVQDVTEGVQALQLGTWHD